jgi:hypothetical protein
MATQAQITANKLNAQNSKGPVTPEGKQAVRFNALKTGIHATQVIITGESSEEFDAFAEAHRITWNPDDLVESAFVDRLIHNSWRLERLRLAEAQIWDRAVAEGANDFGEAFERTEKLLGRLQSQVTSIERSIGQATRELQRIQAARAKAKPQAEAHVPDLPPLPVTERTRLSPEEKEEIYNRWVNQAREVSDSPFDF